MPKSLATIMSQIERLQKEAAVIQREVVGRIRKDVAKYGLTPEQIFGAKDAATRVKVTGKAKTKSRRAPKYADGAGNTWGGFGKRPDWLRQALAAGKAIEEFLIGPSGPVAPEAVATKVGRRRPMAQVAAAPKKVVAKSAAAAKPTTSSKKSRKPRAKPVAGSASV
ncbi:H-NS family nucleoid-associated regulatory protein [Pelomonas sp. Root1444]|uniref:H-NS histone family protein n=1 Tax=Pelomonas sp. Root1444 TaxID=1736464 RepID=UPI0009E849E1|nr:H-NS histone family protein [Pelomonas sp. Root1444]